MIKYVNSMGREIFLTTGGLRIVAETLRDYSWSYSTILRPSGRGGRVKRFAMPPSEKSITLISKGTTKEMCEKQLNEFQSAAETDIVRNQPGRLYIGNQYLKCYIGVSSDIEHINKGYHYAKKKISILAEEPLWVLEVKQEFHAGATEETEIESVKRFTLKYPFRYSTSNANIILYNEHYVECPAIITFYGPSKNPDIAISGHHYTIETEILENERLVINQLDNTIIKIDGAGLKFNEFNKRDKENDVFKHIPSGENYVQYSGKWSFDITLIQQRSEPLWI